MNKYGYFSDARRADKAKERSKCLIKFSTAHLNINALMQC